MERAYEQLKLDFGHQGLSGVFISIGASYDAASSGRTHQAPADVSLISALPDWNIFVPGHADEVENFMRHSVLSGRNSYIRLSEEVALGRSYGGIFVSEICYIVHRIIL